MTSTYTTDLRLTKQGTGDNSGTWGVVANNVFQLIEDSIAGIVTLNVGAVGDYTLSTANGNTDEARNMILKITGTPVSAKNVIIPAVSKLYVVECSIGSAVTITLKTNSGVGINMVTGQKTIAYCDGLNTFQTQVALTDLGITATAGEINILDGITVTTAELNVLDGITATVGELNILDGATVTVAELNVLDGITATVAELNYIDGATSNIQTQLNNLTSVINAVSVNTTVTQLVQAWVNFDGANASIRDSQGIASISRTQVGHYTVNFSSNFANVNYAAVVKSNSDAVNNGNRLINSRVDAQSVGSCTIIVKGEDSGVGVDAAIVNLIIAGRR